MQLKTQHRSLKIKRNPPQKKKYIYIYPDNYPTLTIQFELLFITKQTLVENFLSFFFNVYKRNTRPSRSKVQRKMKKLLKKQFLNKEIITNCLKNIIVTLR